MDYHPTFDHYLAAKLRLFRDVVQDGGVRGGQCGCRTRRGFRRCRDGARADLDDGGRERRDDLAGDARGAHGDAQSLTLAVCRQDLSRACCRWPAPSRPPTPGRRRSAPLGSAKMPRRSLPRWKDLKGAPGRMEKVAFSANGAPIYVDYAHTPDQSGKGAGGAAAPHQQTGCMWCSAAAATATRASAR